jgi:hypothetical protein
MTVTIRNPVDADLDALIRLNAQMQRLHAQIIYPADLKSLTDRDRRTLLVILFGA